MGGRRKIIMERSLGVCSSHTVGLLTHVPHGAPWDELRAVVEGWVQPLSLCPACLKIPFLNISSLTGIMSESRRLKQMVAEAFLSSTHPWCYSVVGKKWKAESYLGGRAGLFLAELQLISFKTIVKCCFFPRHSHSKSHYFYETFFNVIGLKSAGENFLCFPAEFSAVPFLLRPYNIGINSLLIVLAMSCWHFITVIFNSSSEGGVAGPLNIPVFSVVKDGSRCWVNNLLVCI